MALGLRAMARHEPYSTLEVALDKTAEMMDAMTQVRDEAVVRRRIGMAACGDDCGSPRALGAQISRMQEKILDRVTAVTNDCIAPTRVRWEGRRRSGRGRPPSGSRRAGTPRGAAKADRSAEQGGAGLSECVLSRWPAVRLTPSTEAATKGGVKADAARRRLLEEAKRTENTDLTTTDNMLKFERQRLRDTKACGVGRGWVGVGCLSHPAASRSCSSSSCESKCCSTAAPWSA